MQVRPAKPRDNWGDAAVANLKTAAVRVAAAALVGTAVVACAVWAARAAALPDLALIGAGFTAMTVVVIAVRFYFTRDVLDPLVVFSAAIGFDFGVHLIWRYFQPAWDPPFPNPYVSGVVGSTLLLATSYLVLVAAFLLVRFRPRPARTSSQQLHFSTYALWAVFAIGFAADLYGISVGLYQKAGIQADRDTSNLLLVRTIGDLAIVACAVATLQYYRSGAFADRVTAIAQGVALIGFGLAIGHKLAIVSVMAAWLIARHYGGKRLRPMSVAIAMVVFVFVFTPVIHTGRDSAVLRNLDAREQVDTTLRTLPARLQGLAREPDQLLDGFDIINRRSNLAESMALAYAYTPSQRPYQYGASFVDIPLSFFPHHVLPFKTSHDRGRDFAVTYAGVVVNGRRGTAIGPSMPGDLYVNFGALGMLTGFLLLGVALRILRDVVQSADALFAVPLYIVVILKITLLDVSVARMTTAVIHSIAIAWLAWLILRFVSDFTASRPAAGPIPSVSPHSKGLQASH